MSGNIQNIRTVPRSSNEKSNFTSNNNTTTQITSKSRHKSFEFSSLKQLSTLSEPNLSHSRTHNHQTIRTELSHKHYNFNSTSFKWGVPGGPCPLGHSDPRSFELHQWGSQHAEQHIRNRRSSSIFSAANSEFQVSSSESFAPIDRGREWGRWDRFSFSL